MLDCIIWYCTPVSFCMQYSDQEYIHSCKLQRVSSRHHLNSSQSIKPQLQPNGDSVKLRFGMTSRHCNACI